MAPFSIFPLTWHVFYEPTAQDEHIPEHTPGMNLSSQTLSFEFSSKLPVRPPPPCPLPGCVAQGTIRGSPSHMTPPLTNSNEPTSRFLGSQNTVEAVVTAHMT